MQTLLFTLNVYTNMPSSSKSTVLSGFNTTISDTGKEENSLHDHVERIGGHIVTKVHTLDGTGAQSDNLFLVTGSVEVIAIWGEVTSITNNSVCDVCSWVFNDGSDTAITESSFGADLGGLTIGSMIFKDTTAGSSLTYADTITGNFNDGGGSGYFTTFCPFRLTAKNGTSCYIKFKFTGDASTNYQITHSLRFNPLSSDGSVTAV